MKLETAEEFLNKALGGNMNISTLKPAAWHEILRQFAEHYHKAKSVSSDGLEGLLFDIEEDGFVTIRQETGWLVWDGKIMKRPKEGYRLEDIARVAISNKVPF